MLALGRIIAFALFAVSSTLSGLAQVYWSNQSPAGVTDDIWCVTYANGTFAAVTNQGNVLTSSDGLTWQSLKIDPGVWLVSIAYGNGKWVAVGDQGTILVSPDLATWTKQPSPTSNKLNGVIYADEAPAYSMFVAVGDNGTILTSNDAQSWTLVPSGVTGFLRGITYNINHVLVTGQGGVLLKGYNGAGFAAVESGTSADLEAVVGMPAGHGDTCVVGSSGTTIHDFTWIGGLTELSDPFDGWTASPTGTSVTLRGLAYGNGLAVAAGDQGTLLTSPDSENWTQRFAGDSPSTVSTASLLSAAYSEPLQRFVVTGTGGTILVSNTAPTVFANVSTRGYVSSTQTFIGGFVIEGTSPRTVLIRADGPVLSQFSVTGTLPDPVLTVYDSKGDVVAANTSWTTNTNPSAISLAAQQTGAFALPNPSADSALLLTLQPGAYTAQITSAKGNSGIALFEAYTN